MSSHLNTSVAGYLRYCLDLNHRTRKSQGLSFDHWGTREGTDPHSSVKKSTIQFIILVGKSSIQSLFRRILWSIKSNALRIYLPWTVSSVLLFRRMKSTDTAIPNCNGCFLFLLLSKIARESLGSRSCPLWSWSRKCGKNTSISWL